MLAKVPKEGKIMKKTISLIGIISLALIVGLAVISCGGGGSSPESVVKEFYTAVERGNANKMLELSTPESAGMINMVAGMMEDEKVKGQLEERGGIVTTEVTSISDNNATVTATFANGDDDNFDLVKVDGKWKIDLSK